MFAHMHECVRACVRACVHLHWLVFMAAHAVSFIFGMHQEHAGTYT